MTEAPFDVLAVGAHPDDIELGIGGLIHKLSRMGRRIAILDLTEAELSTRGSVEIRREEADAAARIMGALQRENALLPDGALANTRDQQMRIIPFIRLFRPRVLLSLADGDRHPDHHAAHALARDAAFFAGLKKLDTGQEPFRPPRVYFYHPYYEGSVAPRLIVDISEDFDAKLKAVGAYKSQFFNPENKGDETHISSRAFWDNIEHRAAYWGRRAGYLYGEPLFTEGPVGVDLPPGLELA